MRSAQFSPMHPSAPMTEAGELRLPVIPYAEWDDETRAALLQHLRRPERYLSGAPDAPTDARRAGDVRPARCPR